jgi:hypothetical protein
MVRRVVSVVALSIGAIASHAQTPDAARVLADMRQALGGDAAIAAVQAFSVDGMETRTIADHSASSNVEFTCVMPDRCVKVRRVPDPFGGETIETYGFNGDVHIRRRASSIPYPPDPFANETPDQKAARARRAVLASKHEFARLVIGMLGAAAFDPSDVSYGGREPFDGKTADVLLLHAADGSDARLFVDVATRLPLMISWIGLPEIVFTTSSTQVVRQGQVVRSSPDTPFPAGDATAGVTKVERRVYFSEYRAQNGVHWPRRLKEVVAGRVVVDTTLNKFKINPKIDPKRFDPSR